MNLTTNSGNNGTNTADEVCHILKSAPAGHVILIISYSLVFILSLIGNPIIMLVIVKNQNKRMHNPMNYLIFNLAVTDLLITLLSLPLAFTRDISDRWLLGDGACYFLSCSTNAIAVSETLTMTVMAIERYKVVSSPTSTSITNRYIGALLILIWTISISLIIPTVASQEFRIIQFDAYCSYEFRNQHRVEMLVYVSTLFIILFFVPFIIAFFVYAMLAVKLQQRGQESHEQLGETIQRTNQKVMKMLMVIAISLFIVWLPICICFTFIAYHPQFIRNNVCQFHVAYAVCHVFSYTSAVLNPFILILMSDVYRGAVVNLFCKNQVKPWSDRDENNHRLALRHRNATQLSLIPVVNST